MYRENTKNKYDITKSLYDSIGLMLVRSKITILIVGIETSKDYNKKKKKKKLY